MKSIRKRIIALVLFLALVLSILPSFTVLAVDQQPEEDISAFVGVPALENVPFCVDEAVVSDAGHTVRLKYLEDSDNIAVFSNPDGTATKYIFSNPIKYIDDNGDCVDIDNTVETFGTLTDDYKFKTTSAPATTYLPATIGMGEDVKVEHNGFSVQIIPMSDRFAAGTTVASELKTGKDSAVLYSNVFGAGRSLKYTTLYNGVKEDIILNSYIANSNSFNFILKTNGLELAEINGGYFFVDEEDTVIYELSPIFVYDSAEAQNTTGGTYTIEEIKPNDIYALTLTVDEAWLSGATYPVTIDPTVTYDENNGIEDACSYPGISFPSGALSSLVVGNRNGNVYRSYIKFPSFYISPEVYNSFVGAYFNIKTETVSTAPGILIEAYGINKTWSEGDLPNLYPYSDYYSSPKINSTISAGSAFNSIDIKNIFTTWYNNPLIMTSEMGILIKTSDTNESNQYYASLYSSEATNAADRPYLEIIYAPFDNKIVSFINAYSNMYMTVDKGWKYNKMNIYQAVLDNSSTSPQNSQKYRLRYDQTHDAYRIYPMCSMYGRGTVVDVFKISGSIQSGCNIDTWRPLENGECQLFKIHSMADGTYKLLLKHNENLVIAVNDNSTGSSSGTSSTSSGNIFLTSISNSNDAKQRWNIIPEEEDMARDEHYSSLDITYPFAINSTTPYAISSCYGKRNVSSSNGNHWGLDIPAEEGTNLYSMFAGKIVEIGYTSSRGHYIIVEATGANYTVYGKTTKLRYCYMHLVESPTTTTGLKKNDTVTAGQLVAKVGNTGTSSGAHLHISIITDGEDTTNSYTATTDPMAFFDDIEFTYSF